MRCGAYAPHRGRRLPGRAQVRVSLKMRFGFQTTLRDRVAIHGVGVHSAAPAQVILHPADVDSGVMFLRTGLPGGRERLLEAKRANVTDTALCTMLGDASGASVCTVEHLLAALSGLRIDNVLIEIDGPETPIMDGSAADFVSAIDSVGVAQQSRSRRHLKIVKPVRVDRDGGFAEFLPAEHGFRLDVEIDFKSPAIGRQRRVFDLDPPTFRRDIARARTFGFVGDVQKLWQAGYALGSSLDNSVAIDGDVNPQSGGAALRRRVRPPQGARRDWRSVARRRADHRRLPDLSRWPQTQRPGARRAASSVARPTRSSKRRLREPQFRRTERAPIFPRRPRPSPPIDPCPRLASGRILSLRSVADRATVLMSLAFANE